jgi:hypothetical protein
VFLDSDEMSDLEELENNTSDDSGESMVRIEHRNIRPNISN